MFSVIYSPAMLAWSVRMCGLLVAVATALGLAGCTQPQSHATFSLEVEHSPPFDGRALRFEQVQCGFYTATKEKRFVVWEGAYDSGPYWPGAWHRNYCVLLMGDGFLEMQEPLERKRIRLHGVIFGPGIFVGFFPEFTVLFAGEAVCQRVRSGFWISLEGDVDIRHLNLKLRQTDFGYELAEMDPSDRGFMRVQPPTGGGHIHVRWPEGTEMLSIARDILRKYGLGITPDGELRVLLPPDPRAL